MPNPVLPTGRHILGTTPKPDESLVGFVFRLAHRRSMPTAKMLAVQIGLTDTVRRPAHQHLEKLAWIANVDTNELLAISYISEEPNEAVFMGMTISASLLDGHMSSRVLCPACLADSPYHRATWDLSFASACPVHGVEMVHACPACGKHLRWTGNDLTKCSCRADLTEAPCDPVPPELLDGIATAHGLLGDPAFAAEANRALDLPPLADLGPVEALGFLYRVGMDLTPGTRKKLFSLESPANLDDPPHVALHRGLAVARNWPESFLQVPAAVVQKWGPGGVRIAQKWVAAVDRWLAGLDADKGQEVRRVRMLIR